MTDRDPRWEKVSTWIGVKFTGDTEIETLLYPDGWAMVFLLEVEYNDMIWFSCQVIPPADYEQIKNSNEMFGFIWDEMVKNVDSYLDESAKEKNE